MTAERWPLTRNRPGGHGVFSRAVLSSRRAELMGVIHSLPLFPLDLVLYPDEQLPLHIFEPRYKEMTRHCMAEGQPFGIVFAEEGELAAVGSTAAIDRVISRYGGGEMDLLVVGQERFRISHLYEERPYLTADVQTLGDREELIEPHMRERLITQHMKLLEIVGRIVRPSIYEDVERLSYVLAQNAGLEVQQKQRVLEMGSENERIAYLVQYFEVLLPRVEEQESLRRRMRSNGHFKDFPT